MARLVHRRGEAAEEELWFDFADRDVSRVLLPVIHDGQLSLHEWGNRGGGSPKLPKTGWCKRESLEAGKWRWLRPEAIDIPCQFGLEKGVWFQVNEGMRGMLVRDERGQPHVYMLTEPASHYYAVMTRHDRMPILIDQRI